MNRSIATILASLAIPSCQILDRGDATVEPSIQAQARLEEAVILAHQIAHSLELSADLATGGFEESAIAMQESRLRGLRSKATPEYLQRIRATTGLRPAEYNALLRATGPKLSAIRPQGTTPRMFSSASIFDQVVSHLAYEKARPQALSPSMIETDFLSLVRTAKINTR